tara:strand:+ start:408 stop:620 length:213 start_codon:yes stop_codon:yes gene_type:complete
LKICCFIIFNQRVDFGGTCVLIVAKEQFDVGGQVAFRAKFLVLFKIFGQIKSHLISLFYWLTNDLNKNPA